MSTCTSKRIVAIAVDSSDHSEKAFEWFNNNVHHDGDKLVIMHSFEWLLPAIPDMIATDEWERQVEKRNKTVRALEKRYKRKCKALKLEAKILEEAGPPGQVICKLAEQEQVTFIVLGSRGEGIVRRTILGSVSDYVLHHTDVPVVLVPASSSTAPGRASPSGEVRYW
ncbi:universal stress protein Slr1101-like [Montipora foliosa]|uniref:universal stress protein Slr1101-like n=1 Tax=Montipora foliosa TaxID=591990 RepID=UPI0035F1C30B